MTPNKDKAEGIILEILRQSSVGLNKTQLYKTFWIAHLFYANENRGYLSDWPIVKMPRGPGIDKGDHLLTDLVQKGLISITKEQNGPFTEHMCRSTGLQTETQLSVHAVQAIKQAIDYTAKKTAAELSQMSHEYSRGWRDAVLGQEIDIYADTISDEEVARTAHELALAQEELGGLFE